MNTDTATTIPQSNISPQVFNAFVWCGERLKDDWMRHFDLFGKYKMLVESLDDPIPFNITVDENYTMETKLVHIVKTVKSKLVIAAYIVPNYSHLNFRDRSVWEISDGYKSCDLTKILEHFGWIDCPKPYKIGSPEFNDEYEKNRINK